MKNINEMTRVELLVVAKELNIVGRHKMNKCTLKQYIGLNKPTVVIPVNRKLAVVKPKSDYINEVIKGQLVAFKVSMQKAISGKVIEIHKNDLVVKTKNGKKYRILKTKILWVKTKTTWPKFVYNLLRGVK